MSGRSPGGGKGAGGSRCLLILRRCLAIQLQKVRPGDAAAPQQPPPTAASEFWMYDSGYLLFQGFLEANLKCFWNASLLEAMRLLEFQGYVAPGVLLVTASACALEVVRAAWSRNVLKPPNNYVISVVGDVEDCLIQPLAQGQFTPLPEALCWVILDLTSSGQAAVLERIRSALAVTFPDMTRPSTEVVYDTLAKLTQERKVYQTSQGYFVVTPEKRRRHSRSSRGAGGAGSGGVADSGNAETTGGRPMLMSTEEALALVHGEMQTIRDGDVTHQAVQTNLADVICGGNPNDKIIYPRVAKRSSSFPIPNRMERRHSLRLFGSSKRLANSLSRSGSMRHICNKHLQASDSSSSTEYPSTDCSNGHQLSGKKSSLLSRLFRRSGRKQRGSSAPPASLATFSAQFPPVEWFNQRVVHLHSVGTQTMNMTNSYGAQANGVTRWTDEDGTLASSRSATLPRRHRRHTSSGGDSISVTPSVVTNSTPRSSRRHRSPSSCSTLPRPSKTGGGSSNLSRSTSRTSVQPCSKTSEQVTPPGSTLAGTASPSPSIMSRNVSSSSSSPNKSLQRNRSRSPSLGKASSSGSTVIASKMATPASSKVTPSASGSSLPGTKGTNNSPARSATKSSVPNGRGPPALTNGSARNGGNTQVATNKSSITLQVSTTNHTISPPPASSSGYSSVLSDVPSERSVTVTSESPSGGTGTTTTTTINGSNTKVYVQQQNSPVRSVITFENGLNKNKSSAANKDIVILNGFASQKNDSVKNTDSANIEEGKTVEKTKKPERPKSLYGPSELKRGQEKKCPSLEALNVDGLGSDGLRPKLTNALNGSRIPLPVSATSQPSRNTVTSHPNAHPPSTPPTSNDPMMNNTRIVSSAPGFTASKESLSFKNILHDDASDDPKNFFCSNPPSPTKSFDSFGGGSFNNLYIERGLDTKGSNPKEFLTRMRSVEEGFTKSPPEISPGSDLCPYPSLGDLTVHFKSIAAQKILKGVSINSIDTLVEVNMAAAEKQNNCDVTIHTDFGMV